jgi:hypothetical protein
VSDSSTCCCSGTQSRVSCWRCGLVGVRGGEARADSLRRPVGPPPYQHSREPGWTRRRAAPCWPPAAGCRPTRPAALVAGVCLVGHTRGSAHMGTGALAAAAGRSCGAAPALLLRVRSAPPHSAGPGVPLQLAGCGVFPRNDTRAACAVRGSRGGGAKVRSTQWCLPCATGPLQPLT